MALAAMLSVGGSQEKDEEYDVEAKPMPTYYEAEENEHNKQLREALENESEESRMERITFDMCMEQTGSLDECLDDLGKQVREYVQSVNDSTVNHIAKLAGHYGLDTDLFKTVNESDEKQTETEIMLQKSLAYNLPGWIWVESEYNPTAKSSSGAYSWGQFKKTVWNEVMGTKEVSEDLDEHLVAMGRLALKNYGYIEHYAGEETLEELKEQFGSEQDYIYKFMGLLVLNAHNSGGPTIGKGLKKFVESVPVEEREHGKRLFAQFRDFAYKNQSGYGAEQAKYVAKVIAFNSELSERLENNFEEENLAMNDDVKETGKG